MSLVYLTPKSCSFQVHCIACHGACSVHQGWRQDLRILPATASKVPGPFLPGERSGGPSCRGPFAEENEVSCQPQGTRYSHGNHLMLNGGPWLIPGPNTVHLSQSLFFGRPPTQRPSSVPAEWVSVSCSKMGKEERIVRANMVTSFQASFGALSHVKANSPILLTSLQSRTSPCTSEGTAQR